MKFLLVFFLTAICLMAQNRLTGIVKPIYEAKLGSSTEGIVSEVFYKEGDTVKKNDIIIKLDDKLQKLETIRRKVVLEDKTQLVSLQKNLRILEDILIKKEKLYKTTKAISLNELNQLKMQYINTKGEVESLKNNEQKEQIEYKISSEVLEYYNIKAPANAIITKIIPKKGEWVQTGKEIVHIVDISTCFVEIDADVFLLKKLKLNSNVDVEVKVDEKTIIKQGKVSFVSAVADSSSSLVRVKVNFDNKDKAIIPGIAASIVF